MKLIDKNELLEKIEELEAQNNCGTSDFIEAKRIAFRQVKQALDSLEVKEVNLEKEIKSFSMSKELYEADSAIKAVAEHFFELGIKSKGE